MVWFHLILKPHIRVEQARPNDESTCTALSTAELLLPKYLWSWPLYYFIQLNISWIKAGWIQKIHINICELMHIWKCSCYSYVFLAKIPTKGRKQEIRPKMKLHAPLWNVLIQFTHWLPWGLILSMVHLLVIAFVYYDSFDTCDVMQQ